MGDVNRAPVELNDCKYYNLLLRMYIGTRVCVLSWLKIHPEPLLRTHIILTSGQASGNCWVKERVHYQTKCCSVARRWHAKTTPMTAELGRIVTSP